MKSVFLSSSEKCFILESFSHNFRIDGRSLLDSRRFSLRTDIIPHSFGSAAVTFGEAETQIICGIKAEISRPMESEPKKGLVKFFLESSTA